jgi:hypothetical protein
MVTAGATYANLSSFVQTGSGCLGTTATILSGSNGGGGTNTITMAWRPRATDETPGTATHPPIPAGAIGLISDVVQLGGFNPTDAVVLQMNFDAALLGTDSPQLAFDSNALYIGKYTAGSTWTNAGSINEGITNAPSSNLASDVGEYGLGSNGELWVVLSGATANANQFAVVPEPGTLALLLAGCFAVVVPYIRRRMKKSQA